MRTILICKFVRTVLAWTFIAFAVTAGATSKADWAAEIAKADCAQCD